MRTIQAKELHANLDAFLNFSQNERIVISRLGKPCAVLVGIEDYDAEDLRFATSAEFWTMIRERRTTGKSLPLAEVESRLGAGRRKATRKKQNGSKA